MPKSSKRQFLVRLTGIGGYWMTKTGAEITSDTNKVWDGGSLQPQVLAGPPQASNLVVTRGYDPVYDGPILTSLRQQVGRYRTTASVTPTDANLTAAGKPEVYSNALLVGVTVPEVDASSGDAAMIQLEFAIGNWA